MYDNKKLEEIKGIETFVGIDIAKEVHYGSLLSKDGNIRKSGIKIINNKEGFEEFRKILEGIGDKKEIVIGFEPTGHYWKALGYYLKERGYKILLVNPYHVKLSKELRDNRQRKTDKKDSKLIAHLMREGKYLNSLLLEGNYETLRRLTVMREKIVQEKSRCQIRLKSMLDEYLPEYEKCFCNITIKTSVELLKKYGIKDLRDRENKEDIVNDIFRNSKKRINIARAGQIVKKLNESIGIKEGIIAAEMELKIWISRIEDYQKELKLIEAEIKKILEVTDEGKYLLSIPGVGIITAGTILGQTGSFKNYSNPHKLEKLAGLDLVENSSGKKTGQRSISKRGRKFLRHCLYKIAIVCISRNQDIKKLYEYKINQLKKNKMIAITDIMVKLLKIMFGLVKHKRMYDGNFILKNIKCA